MVYLEGKELLLAFAGGEKTPYLRATGVRQSGTSKRKETGDRCKEVSTRWEVGGGKKELVGPSRRAITIN